VNSVGGRAPSRVHIWVSPHLLSLWLFLSSPSACVSVEAWPVLYVFLFTAVLLTCCVNVNTTDATVGATALLLPAQNTHTLHDPKRGTEHAPAGGVEDGLGVGGLDGGGDVGDVVCEEAAGGRAALTVSRVVGGAGEARLASEEAKDGHE
jgi:hypothetical protein